MADLSHWDFAEHFSGYDAAALILGLEPRESSDDEHRVRVVEERIELDYSRAIQQASLSVIPFDDSKLLAPQEEYILSVELEKLWIRALDGDEQPLDDWICSSRSSRFDNQIFNRKALMKWLAVIGMETKYAFDRNCRGKPEFDTGTYIDPAEFPIELDAANMAFRAVSNGYGGKTGTFKKKLLDYLEEHYPNFKPEQVQRIAVVANPDKTTGRKRSAKE